MLDVGSFPEFSSLYELKNGGKTLREQYGDYVKVPMRFLNKERVAVEDFYFAKSKINKEDDVAYIMFTKLSDEKKCLVITSSNVILEELKSIEPKGQKKFVAEICTDNKYYTFR